MAFCLWVGSSLRVQQTLFNETAQPVGKNVGGDMLLRILQQLAKMAAIAEHDVANDDQAPAVAEDLKRQIDRAAGAMQLIHFFFSKKLLAFCHQSI